MRLTPNSTINLYTKVEIDNGEQLVFSSRANQIAYFQSKLVRAYAPCTMVRKRGSVRVEISGSVVSTCNYISFVNPNFDNKEVYARIIDYDYVNNECVEISYAIDYWQTWMFDVQFEDMYIEREHLSQADWEKAEQNPYDPTIFEFRTNENLPISTDLEKQYYTIGSDPDADGFKLGDSLVAHIPNAQNTVGAYIKLAEIDFDDLDSGTVTNKSEAFVTFLEGIRTQSLGYYTLTKPMYDYLHAKYSSRVPNKQFIGNGWKYDNSNLDPTKTSNFQPCCCEIYDQYGGATQTAGATPYIPNLLKTLTQWGMVDQIITMIAVPNDIFVLAGRFSGGGLPVTMEQVTAKTKLTVDSKKLMRFPYSYLRVISPNGDIKEYKYEFFKDVQDGTDLCSFPVILDVSSQPTLIIAPGKYKVSGMSSDVNIHANVIEALLFSQFPEVPYTLDAFLTQVAATSVDIIANRTVDNAWDMAKRESSLSEEAEMYDWIANQYIPILSLAGNGGANIANAGKTALNTFNEYGTSVNYTTERGKMENDTAMWRQAEDAMVGKDGDVISQNFSLAKPAYAANKYIPSNGLGTINFNKNSFCDIICLRVSLNSDVLAVYDNWFKRYGYTSGRCGIPRVINYIKGEATDDVLPHWELIDNKYATYIKTMDCKIIHSMLPVASTIKSMFDSGVRMIKGDLA